MKQLQDLLQSVIKQQYDVEPSVTLSRPEEQFGDYSTNVALQLSKQLGKNPRDIAQAIVDKLVHKHIVKVEIAGPGFINFTMTDAYLWKLISIEPTTQLAGKTVVAEYSDPNPFKALHAGHLYTSLVGDAIA